MNTGKSKNKIFFGWWTVILTAIMTGLGNALYGSGASILFKPIATDLGISRAAASFASSIARLEGGIEAPLTGWLCDKYGPKWVMIAGLLLFIGGLIFMYYVSTPWTYYVAWGVMVGIGYNLALTIAIDKALANWFIRKRGLSFGIRFTIIGICGVITLPLVTFLVVNFDWRITCLIWAAILGTGIPITLLFVKQDRPEYYGLLPDGISADIAQDNKDAIYQISREYAENIQESEFTVRQAIKTQAYWFICLAWSCNILVTGGFSLHIVPFLTDMGIPTTVAGGMLSLMVFFTIPSRLVAGLLTDHLPKDRLQFIAAVAFFLQAVGIAAFLIKPDLQMAYVLLILYGLGNGAPTPVRLTIGGRFFGRKAFASILGSTMLVTAPVSMVSPIYAGWIYDRTGSYNNAFLLFAILLAVSALLVSFVRPPKTCEMIDGVKPSAYN